MPRPPRKSALAVQPRVVKKQQRPKDPRIARAVLERADALADELHLAVTECQGEVQTHLDSWNLFLDGTPGYWEELTAEHARRISQSLSIATLALKRLGAVRGEIRRAIDDMRGSVA